MIGGAAPSAGLDRKRLATLTARAALAGITLQCIEGDFGADIFIVTHPHWALTRQLESLDEVERWLDQVTGKKEAQA